MRRRAAEGAGSPASSLESPAMSRAFSLSDFEALAESKLDRAAFDYFAGGAEDETTLAANREAFRRRRLLPRVLVDVSRVDTGVTLLGSALSSPVVVAPTALHRLAHPDGESGTARAAAAAGSLLVLSTISTTPLEEVAKAGGGGPRWFQLYHYRDRPFSEELARRAAAAGYRAIVLTVDAPVLGRRERDLRNGFALPAGVEPAHGPGRAAGAVGGHPLLGVINQAALTWHDLEWLRAASGLPIVLKGIVRADDARRAVAEGVDAIWVSNHGGRQLDGAVATADAVPAVVDAVAGRAPVIVDGGIRRGTDVLKALALGATAVAVGRPILWGLAAEGEAGVARVLAMLAEELATAMALAGCASPAGVDRSLVA